MLRTEHYAFLPCISRALQEQDLLGIRRELRVRQQRLSMQQSRSKLGRVCVTGANSPLGQELVGALTRTPDPSLRPDAIGVIGARDPVESHSAGAGLHFPGPGVDFLECAATDLEHYNPRTLFSINDEDLGLRRRSIFRENQVVIDLLRAQGETNEPRSKTRLVLVTLLGCGDSEDAIPSQAFDVLRPLLLELSRVEQYVRESGLPYTIVRPGALEHGDADSRAIVSESKVGFGTIHRSTLAHLLLNVAASEKAVNKTLMALDMNRLLVAAPYVRPFEVWESPPFEVFDL
jgi:hypothetical protein